MNFQEEKVSSCFIFLMVSSIFLSNIYVCISGVRNDSRNSCQTILRGVIIENEMKTHPVGYPRA